jgi:FKBP-type peptidyl-prolyl cis-trans isomerase
MSRNCFLIGCLLIAASVSGCKSKESAAAPEASDQKVTIVGPQAGELPAPADVAAAPDDAERTESGLACIVLRKGTGAERPAMYDTLEMHQVVWTTDGKMHMNTGNRGAPVEFSLTKSVLPGLRGRVLVTRNQDRPVWSR